MVPFCGSELYCSYCHQSSHYPLLFTLALAQFCYSAMLFDVPTCMSYVLFVVQRRINYWDRHQGLDLGVQGHIPLVFNE